jgi:hypothetical protein
MNTPNRASVDEIDALRDDLRPSERSLRPIPLLEPRPITQIGGGR